MTIAPEQLAYWYLRLNGFLTIVNFLVHPETRKDRSTEVDILGVRFPFRAENLTEPMDDHSALTCTGTRIQIVVAEVKRSECSLNGPWRDREAGSMEKILAAMGAFPEAKREGVARALYDQGCFQDENYDLSLLCIGRTCNEELKDSLPQVRQVTFKEILTFIHARFLKYLSVKAQHQQWDRDGIELFNAVSQNRDLGRFLATVRVEPAASPIGP